MRVLHVACKPGVDLQPSLWFPLTRDADPGGGKVGAARALAFSTMGDRRSTSHVGNTARSVAKLETAPSERAGVPLAPALSPHDRLSLQEVSEEAWNALFAPKEPLASEFEDEPGDPAASRKRS